MKKLLLSLVMLSACTDMFVTTTSSPGTLTTVEPTPTMPITSHVAEQLEIGEICAAVAANRGSSAQAEKIAELRQKADFTAVEIRLIASGEVAVGMSERAGICALGGNSMKADSVKTTTTEGHFVQEMTFIGGTVLTTDNYVVIGVRR